MESGQDLKLSEFSKTLTKGRLFTFRVIGSALFAGLTLFLGVIAVLYIMHMPDPATGKEVADNDKLLPVLSLVHCVIAISGYLAALFINYVFVSPNIFLRSYHKMQVSLSPDEDTPEARYFVRLFIAYLIRMAILEGISLFGMVICLLSVTEGEIYEMPFYWANLFSYGIFVTVFLWTFPTKSKLEAVFQSRFMPDDEILKA